MFGVSKSRNLTPLELWPSAKNKFSSEKWWAQTLHSLFAPYFLYHLYRFVNFFFCWLIGNYAPYTNNLLEWVLIVCWIFYTPSWYYISTCSAFMILSNKILKNMSARNSWSVKGTFYRIHSFSTRSFRSLLTNCT